MKSYEVSLGGGDFIPALPSVCGFSGTEFPDSVTIEQIKFCYGIDYAGSIEIREVTNESKQ